MQCKRCRERGQTWKGDPPVCGFSEDFFSKENYQCATLNQLRFFSDDEHTVDSEEQHLSTLPFGGRFIILSWYKNRGRTEGAWTIDGLTVRSLTLAIAEEFLELLEQ